MISCLKRIQLLWVFTCSGGGEKGGGGGGKKEKDLFTSFSPEPRGGSERGGEITLMISSQRFSVQ